MADRPLVENLQAERAVVAGHVETINLEDRSHDVAGRPSPYLGLASFTYQTRDRYAGRERQVDQAMQLLTTPGDERVVLFVTGASGSGKSSFAQAGLVPKLEEHYRRLGQTPRWAVFRPSRYPLAGLARCCGYFAHPCGEVRSGPEARCSAGRSKLARRSPSSDSPWHRLGRHP